MLILHLSNKKKIVHYRMKNIPPERKNIARDPVYQIDVDKIENTQSKFTRLLNFSSFRISENEIVYLK